MDKKWIDEAVEQYMSEDGDCDYDWDTISDLLSKSKDVTVEDLRKLTVWEDSRVLASLISHPACDIQLVQDLNVKEVDAMHDIHTAILFSPLCTPELRSYILSTDQKFWSHLPQDEIERRKKVLEQAYKDDPEDVIVRRALGWIKSKEGNRKESLAIWGVSEPSSKYMTEGLWEYEKPSPKKFKTPKGMDLDELTQNPAVNPWLLYQFSFLNSDYYESFVASNPSSPLLILEYYAQACLEESMSSLVFSNPALPSHLFRYGFSKRLYEHQFGIVLGELAANVAIPNELIKHLAKHKDPEVYRALANNPVFLGNTVLSKAETEKVIKKAEASY
jgi:hypothetical protein